MREDVSLVFSARSGGSIYILSQNALPSLVDVDVDVDVDVEMSRNGQQSDLNIPNTTP